MSSRKELSVGELKREREMLRELKKFHRENAHLAAPVATHFTKKRVRVPQVQPETNPFCMERQLADEYALLNLNKNPRFYTPSIKNSPRLEENPRNHSSFINQAADLMASSGFSPRARAEFAASMPPTTYQPGRFKDPKVVSIDSGDLRQVLDETEPTNSSVVHSPRFFPPSHEQYGTRLSKLTVTFGHRPEDGSSERDTNLTAQSAARMYDPLSSSIERPSASKSKSARQQQHHQQGGTSTSVKTGMSVMQLQELLAPVKQQVEPASKSSSSRTDSPSSRSPRRIPPVQERMRTIEREREQQEAKQSALEELERGYTNAVFNPPRERKPVRFLPPTDHTTGQLIDKYRKLAVGKLPAPV